MENNLERLIGDKSEDELAFVACAALPFLPKPEVLRCAPFNEHLSRIYYAARIVEQVSEVYKHHIRKIITPVVGRCRGKEVPWGYFEGKFFRPFIGAVTYRMLSGYSHFDIKTTLDPDMNEAENLRGFKPTLALIEEGETEISRYSKKTGSFVDSGIISSFVAVEKAHMYTLILDEIQDGAKQRRGHPTLNAVFGNEIAELIGGIVAKRATNLSLRSKYPLVQKILSECLVRTAWGQIQEFTIRDTLRDLRGEGNESRIKETLRSIYEQQICSSGEKTGPLIGASTRIAALYNAATEETVGALCSYTESLGLAVQITDDALDVYGNRKRMGKDVRKDMRLNLANRVVGEALRSKNLKKTEKRIIVQALTGDGMDDELYERAYDIVAQRGREGIDVALIEQLRLVSKGADSIPAPVEDIKFLKFIGDLISIRAA